MPKFRPNETEEAYLEGEEQDLPKSYRDRPDKIESGIKDKAELIPERFERLFQDILLFDRNGYLDHRTWRGDPIRLFRAPYLRDSFTYTPPKMASMGGTNHSPSAAEEWGKRLGAAVARLLPSLREAHGDKARKEVVWGFMKGMRSHPDDQLTLRFVRDTSRMLAKRASDEIELWNEADDRSQQSFEHSVKRGEEIREDIKRVIEEAGISPGDWMVRRTRQHLTAVLKAPLEAIDWELTDDEHPTDEGVSQELILNIVREHRLPQKQQLVNLLVKDGKRIRQKSGQGTNGVEVLTQIFEKQETEKTNSKSIAGGLNVKSVGSVTRVAMDLAGDPEGRVNWKERGIDVWTDRQMLVRKENGEWKTTAYGSVQAHHLQLPEAVALLHPLSDIPEDAVDSAIEELGL